jgi:hypothetical protein
MVVTFGYPDVSLFQTGCPGLFEDDGTPCISCQGAAGLPQAFGQFTGSVRLFGWGTDNKHRSIVIFFEKRAYA